MMTHDSPSLFEVCPVHPGNPRRNIEGESPHFVEGTYSLADLRLMRFWGRREFELSQAALLKRTHPEKAAK